MTKQLLESKFKFLFSKLKKTKIKELPKYPEVRGVLFSLEGILRLHQRGMYFKDKELKTITKALARLKSLEDDLGAYSYSVEINEYFIQRTKQEEPALNKNIKKAKKKFKQTYKFKVKQLKKSYTQLLKLKWPKAENVIPHYLNSEINRISEKTIKKLKPLILKKKYSDYEIQEGLHEWRRMLRWVSIYFQAYKELFHLSPEKPANNQETKLISLYKKDIFCLLGPKSANFKISSLAFYKLSDYIKKVGELKSEAEMVRTLTHDFNLKLSSNFKETQVHNIYKSYEKSNVLKQLIIKEKKHAVSKKV